MILTVAPSDLWSLRRKPRHQLLLHTEQLIAYGHRPLWFALQCLLQGTGRDRSVALYRDRGVSAMVQAQGRPGRPEQDVIYLSAYGARTPGLPTDQDIWFRLLERLCINAGQSQVQRLYTSIPSQHNEVREIFRQLGFQAYAHRTILLLSGPDWDQGTTIASMRGQSRRDHWAIHKLYGAVTPHLVQHVEAHNSRSWALPLTNRHGLQRRAWVLGPDDDLTAYLNVLSGPSANVMTLLIHPEARDDITDVLRFGLGQLHDTRPVYLLIREYHQELLAPAQDLGFQPIGEQTLLMKSTVVAVRRSLLIPALEGGLEPKVTAPRITTPREVS